MTRKTSMLLWLVVAYLLGALTGSMIKFLALLGIPALLAAAWFFNRKTKKETTA